MARFRDYIAALDADEGAPEGSGNIVFRLLFSGYGTDGNYGGFSIRPTVEATGYNESKGTVTFPKTTVEGYSGTHGSVRFPALTVDATRLHGGAVAVSFGWSLLGDGDEAPVEGGFVDFPALYVRGTGGVAVKIFDLCEDSNWGL